MPLTEIEMITCPIDQNHEVKRQNLVKHLLKCIQKNGGRVAWTVCPYNIAHCVPTSDLLTHVSNCTDKQDFSGMCNENQRIFENIAENESDEEEFWN